MVKTSASYKYLRKSPCETLNESLRACFEMDCHFSGSAGNFAVFGKCCFSPTDSLQCKNTRQLSREKAASCF
jgi:hypothetical protein